MKKPSDPAQIALGLRQRAERLLSVEQEAAEETTFNEKKLLHELQVQQIQLEMQNEALQEARNAAERALESYAELFDYAPIAYFTLTPTGIIRKTNFRGGVLLGAERLRLYGKYFSHSVSNEYRPTFDRFLKKVFASVCDGTQHCEIMLHINKNIRWVVVEAAADPTRQTCLAAVLDITAKKQSEAIILQQANFDPLTGLPNRRMFIDRLQQAIQKSRRADNKLALMFLDLDHFKDINDTLGHDIGDELLKETAKRLQTCIRETDTLARPGGDEFTLVMDELDDPKSVDRVAQCILHCMSEPFQLKDERCYVSFSIGIALYPDDASDLDGLFKKADQAMYAAKQQGRNRFCYFTPAMQQAAEQRMRMVNDLHTALASHQFWVAYQPIVELATGEVHKAEALLRWQHPTLGLIGPTEFIPVAEDTGLIIEIGEWIFHQAAEQVGKWRAHGNPMFQISVNKSPAQFGRKQTDWFQYLQHMGLPGACIVVEITEGLLLDVSPAVAETLLSFRDSGMQVSLDDFGTGYSSLSFLKKFHIDYLKIDQNFVSNLTADSTDMTLCEAIILMAHKLGMQVIAEGIETIGQRDLLLAAGCDYGQGFLFSEPVTAEEFEKLF
ncbi:MAG: EAL domain-containing protein [Proteobacteria bacterium]|nr:EAL domain-containing protein [Pseudomonadota bacterium]